MYTSLYSGFVGHSYLVHNLNLENKTVKDGLDIEIQFKTRHSEGEEFKLILINYTLSLLGENTEIRRAWKYKYFKSFQPRWVVDTTFSM